MTTKLSKKPRIPIPEDIQPGDVLVLRDGRRKKWEKWDLDGTSFCEGQLPGVHLPDGRSWAHRYRVEWDVVAIVRKPKPKKARPDKDAAYLVRFTGAMFTHQAHARSRLRAIAKRLNGGVAP